MAMSLEDDVYPFSFSRKGVAVIIVNSQYQGHAESREGSAKDEILLYEMFNQLDFKIHVIPNYGALALLKELTRVSREHLSDADCLAVAISTHGGEYLSQENSMEDFIVTYDSRLKTKMILDLFTDEKCPSLEGKPRLFFIQACRGDKVDSGQEVQEITMAGETYLRAITSAQSQAPGQSGPGSIPQRSPQRNETPRDTASNRLIDKPLSEVVVRPAPCYKDFLVMYATPPGHYAFRNPTNGSKFLRFLHHVLVNVNAAGSLTLSQCLTRVIGMVTQKTSHTPSKPWWHQKMQTPVIYSMLIKDLYFKPRQSL